MSFQVCVQIVFARLSLGNDVIRDKLHFLALASRVMRQVLVDYARARSTKKRAAQWNVDAVEVDDVIEPVSPLGCVSE